MRHSNHRRSHARILLFVPLYLVACGGSNDDEGGSDNPGTDVTAPITSASPPGGAYQAPQTVKLTSNEAATIYYTIDGSTPEIGDPGTSSGPSPVTGIALSTSPTTIKFFGVDTAGNEEVVRTQSYVIDAIDPIVATIGPPPKLFGLLTAHTIAWQSSENGTYRIQLGGDGTPGTGLVLQVGSATASTQQEFDIHGWRLSFGPAQPLWILVADAANNIGSTSVDLELKELESLPMNPETRGIAITPDGTRVLLSFHNAHEIAAYDIDPASPDFHTQVAGISVGFHPNDFAITPDGTRAYVGHDGGIDVIDIDSEAVDPIAVPGVDPIADVVVTADGERAYFARSGLLFVLDTDPESPSYHFLETASSNIALLQSANLAVTPDGKRLLVAWFGVAAYMVQVIDVDPASPTFHLVLATLVPLTVANSVAPSVSHDSQFGFVGNGSGNLARVNFDLSPIAIDFTTASLSPDATLLAQGDEHLLVLDTNAAAIPIANPGTLQIVGFVPWQRLGEHGAITPDGARAYLLRNVSTAEQELVAVPLE